MSADDGNKPKGPKESLGRQLLMKQLAKSPHEDSVKIGNIYPVRKRLQELLSAHRGELSPEQCEMLEALETMDKAAKEQGCGDTPLNGQTERIKAYTSKWEKNESEDEFPKVDFPEGPKIAQPVIETPAKKKPGEPGESPPLIDPEQPEKMTPDMARYLSFDSSLRPDLLPDFMHDKGKDPRPGLDNMRRTFRTLGRAYGPARASPIVLDPKTGQPIRKHPPSSNQASPDANKKEPHPVRRMLDKDKRLCDADKDAIMDAVSARQDEIGDNGKSLGDITREEVEKYLAKKGEPKIQLQIDLEAAVRILKEFCSDMAILEKQEKEGWLSPVVDELNRTEVNGWSLPTFKSVEIYWHSKDEVLESIHAIPKSRLDDGIRGSMTVRELLQKVVDSSTINSVKDAAMEKLQ